jgi:hypothetical protein
MKSWMARLGLILAMLAMLLAVSVPAMAQLDDELDEFELDVGDCEIVSSGDDDGDGVEDEDESDGIDDDEDGWEGEDGFWLVCELELDFDLDGINDDEDDDDDNDGINDDEDDD